MAEVYRKANYREGVGIVNAHLARNIHFMGIGGMPGYEQGKPVGKPGKGKGSKWAEYFPINWKTCLKLDEIYYRNALKILGEVGNIQQRGVVYNGLAYKCIERDKYDSAVLLYNTARKLAYQMNDTRELLHYAQTPPDIYLAKGDYKTAVMYYYNYIFFLDSLNQTNNEQTLRGLEKSYSLKLKENEIDKLQTDARYQQNRQRQQMVIFAVALVFLIIVLGLGGYAYYQRQQSNQQLQKNLELQSQLQKNLEGLLNEAQLTAARAQMNPHFVFNSISAIQNLILKENKTEAITYLNDFSKLTRETLENSSKETINLKEEISFLNHYLQLESLRSSGKFDYSISCDPSIDISYERIPPMLVQPFVENAIKHGILPRIDKGTIVISFKKPDENILVISVEDDGIGREASGKLKEEHAQHQSMAMNITETRMEKMSKRKSSSHNYSIVITDKLNEDGMAEGTQVTINIPLDIAKSLTA